MSNTIDLLLAESFKEIAVTKPIEKITIKEITDRAGVIRPTFYNHFQDKYELMEWIIQTELISPMKPLLKEYKFQEALNLPFDALLSNREYYNQASKLEGQNSFDSIMRLSLRDMLMHFLNIKKLSETVPYEWMSVELLAEFYSESLAYLMITWIKSGMKVPKEELADGVIFVMSNAPISVVRDAKWF
jgi:probable dihydroxyacetone kinase regulator